MSGLSRREIKLAEAAVDVSNLQSSRGGKGTRYREERITVPESIKCTLKWRDFYGVESITRVQDISRYGCRVILPPNSNVQRLFVRVQRAQIEIDSVIAYSGSIIFVNERQEADGSISAGVTLENTGCDLDALSAAAGARSISIENDLKRVIELAGNVEDEFKVLIAELNVILQEAKLKLDSEEARLVEIAHSENHRYRLEERVINIAMSIYRPHLQAILLKFQTFVSEMSVDEETTYKQYFRLNFQSLVSGTPFVQRGLKKPLGYSGDYGMMVMLYEYADQGDTLFHKFFHRFVCSEPAAVANRNRVGFLSDILLHAYDQAVKTGATQFNIASLACGPAREIYEFLRFAPLKSSCPVKIVLIDLEDHALTYAQNRLKEIAAPEKSLELVFLKEDVVTGTLQNKEFLNWIKESDFIISAGLFDYLTDRVSQRMVSALYPYLTKEGQILIGNISKRSPDVFAMDYFMDWRLILRDEPDLLKMVNPDLITNQGALADVISESLGLNLFLRVQKKE